MGTVHEIEAAISKLLRHELVTLRDWFFQAVQAEIANVRAAVP